MDLRDLPQSRPLLPLHNVPAMDRRALGDFGLVRARRRAEDPVSRLARFMNEERH
jgi:hypothetical protein